MSKQDYAQLSIFSGLDGNQISLLLHFMVECQFPKDCVVFEQGQPAEYLYVLLTGEVAVRYKPYDGPPLTVAHIEPGGVFGWSAALQRDRYTSAAVTGSDCTALRIRGSDMQFLCEMHPTTGKIFLERLASVIAERLRCTHHQVLDILTEGLASQGVSMRRNTQNDRK